MALAAVAVAGAAHAREPAAEGAGWTIAFHPAGVAPRADILLLGTHSPERVEVRQEVDGDPIVFRSAPKGADPAAPFVSVTGCDQLSDLEVSCPDVADETHSGYLLVLPDGLQGAAEGAGAGDTVTWQVQDPRAGVHVFGGEGDDRFRGSSPGLARAFGDGGDDHLAVRRAALPDQEAGPRDRVFGGEGDDELYGSVVSGGPGDDRLFVVTADPDAAHVLRGQAGDDVLTGSDLDDTLRAGRGRDRVVGGSGSDVLYGGRGPDALGSRDGVDDDVNCGRGDDTVRSDWRDLLHRCEHRIR